MKKTFVLIIFTAVFGTSSQTTTNPAIITKNEYLDCSGQHDSTWSGYTVHLKKLSNGTVVGVLWKFRALSRNTHTPPFEVHVKERIDHKAVTYSNEEHGIEFTVYKDSYSGVLIAEAYQRSYAGPSELLCEKGKPDSFYFWHVDPRRNGRDTNLTNVTHFYNMN
ncbi:MAG: hypothetical protein KA715_11610 [Xanthomonadaceae bacterium]|nr:hypothetical protein [Xanthomonadaceae bacterium]